MEREITGVMIYYYEVCKRKLWYFYNEIQMEQGNENVLIGRAIDEETYKRDKKHINIDNIINIDFIRSKGVLHEVKKSNKIEEASILQVKYYLYFLQKRGVYNIRGKIDYPLLKQSIDVELSDEDIKEIDEILINIKNTVKASNPPSLDKKRICQSCAYYDLCFI
ncbi:MAG: CRISPR-associated protein Cas4 [Clostridium celatum]|uniref:CRISPR-associated protein Cas4 n=1 Tax=Clostridium sp. TaxID=1506 RepID=UPI0025BC6867|nr:CRISPR-associated protein Cas4 [Clostridium sp.]MBS4955680.1 CRISPR-associated protein Cas4 [Clostridium sp.]MDU4883870.1 CRISPR-associated protein Cas4 [Clostridium celatum]MDU5261989.1 CRISPR-associated protein Cas4 [Clostridium celatum]MDU7077113.1 CRISPR-associated protein Cas4 [Clostridium celatum]